MKSKSTPYTCSGAEPLASGWGIPFRLSAEGRQKIRRKEEGLSGGRETGFGAGGEVLVLCRVEHVQVYTVTLSLLFFKGCVSPDQR